MRQRISLFYVQEERTDTCSCSICTSTIHGGRMQRAHGGAGAYVQEEPRYVDDVNCGNLIGHTSSDRHQLTLVLVLIQYELVWT